MLVGQGARGGDVPRPAEGGGRRCAVVSVGLALALGLVACSAGASDVAQDASDAVADTVSDTIVDTVSDTVADTASDTVSDTVADTVADTGSDALMDAGSDATADVASDTVADTVADMSSDTVADTAADVASDTASDTAPDTSTPPLGAFASPIPIALVSTTTPPFTASASGDTAAGPSDLADSYAPCAPATPEHGHEVVYIVKVGPDAPVGGVLTVAVDDVPGDGVDDDVHLLDAPSPDACVARDNVAVSHAVSPGETWWVAVDAWTDASGADLEGPFTVTFAISDAPAADPCLVNPIPDCGEGDTPLVNGVPVEPPGLGGCPPGMTRVSSSQPPAFCVDRWEATLVSVLPDGTLSPWSPYAHPTVEDAVRAVSAPGVVPQGYMDQVGAAAACALAGKRLCTDAEWLRACRGAAGHTFPYGDNLASGACNGARACHPVVQYFETTASWIWAELGHPCIDQLPDGLAPTGSFPACVSEDGAWDLVGNLHEWTSDPAGTFRGGFFVDTAINGPGCLYATTAHNVWHWDYSTGFRCCADVL